VIDDWKTGLRFSTGDAFLNYALQGENWRKLDAIEYSTQSFVAQHVEPRIASVPQNLRLEWAPGTGKSEICAPGVTPKGGGACNLVAWGLLDQNLRADMAILKAGDCGSDLASGKFTKNKASTLIPANPSLVTVKLTGPRIVDILEQAVDATIRLEGARSDAYPYSGALTRFNVDTTASLGNRLSSVELYTSYNRWIQLDSNSTYTILTTSELAAGKDPDYQGFLAADASSIRPMILGSIDTFIKYAVEWDISYDPPTEKYSTQSYIS
jgi:2',3'-cyclic-nucleotide 2'-phosphodiesterase (5'-nucleotidase family)